MHIGPFETKNTNYEKLLGIKVDSRLTFNEHLDGIIKKASRKINAISRITPFMNISKRRILLNSFFNSQLTIVLWFGCFIVVQLTRLTVTPFPNLFSTTACHMKTRPYLGNLYLMKKNEKKHLGHT